MCDYFSKCVVHLFKKDIFNFDKKTLAYLSHSYSFYRNDNGEIDRMYATEIVLVYK